MKREVITMRFMSPHHITYVSADEWSFAPAGRWRWLQQAAWWFLRKTRGVSNAVKNTVEYREVRIDTRKVTDAIVRAMTELAIANQRPTRVFMGPKQIDEALFELGRSHSFEVTMGFDRKIFGMPVTIVPWMDGVLVLAD